MNNRSYTVYVLKRAGVDEFIRAMSQIYELVIFTASVQCYGNPIINKLDPNRLIKHRVFRDNCTFLGNGFTKDLRKLGRDLKNTIILDNCPQSYTLQPNNGIPSRTWMGDKNDRQLEDLIPVLLELAKVPDVRESIKKIVKYNHIDKDFALKVLQQETKTLAATLETKEENKKSGLEQISNDAVPYNAFLARRQPRTMSADKNTNGTFNKPAPINNAQRVANIKYNPYTNTSKATNDQVPLINSAISMIKRPQRNLMLRENPVLNSKVPIKAPTEEQAPTTAKVNYHYRSTPSKDERGRVQLIQNGRQNLIGVNFFNPLKEANKDKANVYKLSNLGSFPATSKLHNHFLSRSNAEQYRGGVI
jgi:Dullard-like phosphatase family protein